MPCQLLLEDSDPTFCFDAAGSGCDPSLKRDQIRKTLTKFMCTKIELQQCLTAFWPIPRKYLYVINSLNWATLIKEWIYKNSADFFDKDVETCLGSGSGLQGSFLPADPDIDPTGSGSTTLVPIQSSPLHVKESTNILFCFVEIFYHCAQALNLNWKVFLCLKTFRIRTCRKRPRISNTGRKVRYRYVNEYLRKLEQQGKNDSI